MEFLPDDIAGREFLSAVGGFDREEVRQFLRAVAAQIRDKNRQIKELNEKVRALEERLSEEPSVRTVDAKVLVDLEDEARKLVDDLRRSVDEISAVVSELRDAKQVVAELPDSAPVTKKTEPPAAIVNTGRPPAADEHLRATPPTEWQDLLADPQ